MTPCSLPGLCLTRLGIMSQRWRRWRLCPREHRAMSEPFHCMFTVLIQRNCSPTAAQTVKRSWMLPVLGQQGTPFGPSVILSSFRVSTETPFSSYPTLSHVNQQTNTAWVLRPAKLGVWAWVLRCILLLGTNGLSLAFLERVLLNVATALCLQRCHGTLVYIWFPLRLCLTTSRPHIWSSSRHWLSPSISSWLLSLPGELKGEREREREGESRWGRGGARARARAGAEVGPRNEHITASFPPCSALVWSDSSPSRPKGKLLPGLCVARYPCSPSHSPLTLLESYFSLNRLVLWRGI